MTTPVVGTDAAGVTRSAACVGGGGVLLYPTETVYGLGCDSTRVDAVERIRGLKKSAADKPMLVLTDEWARVETWFADIPGALSRLMNHPTALPITLLAAASELAPSHLVGPEGWVGVRRTSDSFCRALIAATEKPLLSTSANSVGGPPPALFDEISQEVLQGVDLAVDAGRALRGVPSTIVRVDGSSVRIVRDGAVDAETIREIAG